MNRAEDILEYWFDDLDDRSVLTTDSPLFKRWFGKDEATDREILKRFEGDYERAVRGECDPWQDSAEGSLALVVLLDQFPRNMYRGTARAFAADEKALDVCQRAVQRGHDRELSLVRRMFLYMPMMHAESPAVQEQSKKHYETLVEEARTRSPENVDFFAYSRDYARRHAEIIERFGRYPHRNEALGRASSPEEVAFLEEPNSSF